MTVKILLFSSLRDYVGSKVIELEIPADSTITYMKETLLEKYPSLISLKHSIVAAINLEFVADDQTIPLNAEVALFPPVSGG